MSLSLLVQLLEIPLYGGTFADIFDVDSPEKYVDAPICLQLVGKHFCDENLVAACRVVQNIIV